MTQSIEEILRVAICSAEAIGTGMDVGDALLNFGADPVTSSMGAAQAALTALRDAGFTVRKEADAPTREEFARLKSRVDILDKWVREFVSNVQRRAAETGR